MAVPIPRPRPNNERASNLVFPLEEAPPFRTLITFSEYLRPNADSSVAVGEVRTVVLPIPIGGVPDNTVTMNETADMGPFWRRIFKTVREGVAKYEKGKDGKKGFDQKKFFDTVFEGGAEVTVSLWDEFTGGGDDFQAFLALNPGMKDSLSSIQRYAQTQKGIVLNPHTTLMFDGVELKKYSLQFKCSPRSQRENESIQNIIATIKQRMLPTKSSNLFALHYPDTVEISFENTVGLPQIQKSFLTHFSVVYTSGTGISFYEDGKPLEYLLQMSLSEIEIRTREGFADNLEPEVISLLDAGTR